MYPQAWRDGIKIRATSHNEWNSLAPDCGLVRCTQNTCSCNWFYINSPKTL